MFTAISFILVFLIALLPLIVIMAIDWKILVQAQEARNIEIKKLNRN